MEECCVCYEMTGDTTLCHPICVLCLQVWIKMSKRKEHRTVYCPYCRTIIKHIKDDRKVIFCYDCDKDVLFHHKKVTNRYDEYKYRKQAIEHIQFLF